MSIEALIFILEKEYNFINICISNYIFVQFFKVYILIFEIQNADEKLFKIIRLSFLCLLLTKKLCLLIMLNFQKVIFKLVFTYV